MGVAYPCAVVGMGHADVMPETGMHWPVAPVAMFDITNNERTATVAMIIFIIDLPLSELDNYVVNVLRLPVHIQHPLP